MSAAPQITPLREKPGKHDAAILFIHGFTGSGQTTWSILAPRIVADARLASWDAWTMTYASGRSADILGIWAADPDLARLGQRLATDINDAALSDYKTLVLIAHSMGGLVVQKALVDSDALAKKTHAVILFGTPSNGLQKASWVQFWKQQLQGVSADGEFIKTLRADWTKRFGSGALFSFLAVAGERDQFVPPHSSLDSFPKSQQAVVAGDHLSMISPAPNDCNVIDLVARRIVENDVGTDIGDSALRAMERGEFNRIIDGRLKRAKELDSTALVQLAIALDAVGRRKEAEDVLVGANRNVSDVYGTIAGRRKRMWLLERREADAVAAMENYSKGLELATTGPSKKSLTQAYYHGINLAFLELVYNRDHDAARRRAREVLALCDQCDAERLADEWLKATRGEAYLILGDTSAAFDAYREFVTAVADPWKRASTYLNARTIAADAGSQNSCVRTPENLWR